MTMEVKAPRGNRNQWREEDMDISNTMLPHDMMLVILSKLPGKSLVRFRFISKSWYQLIRSPFFINKHFHRFRKQDSGKGTFIIEDINHDIFTLDFKEHNQCVDVKKLKLLGRETGMRCQKIWGSCNGLICVQLFRPDDPISPLYLWNPCTMEYKEIPPTRTDPLTSQTNYALRYNFLVDDYEILEVSSIENPCNYRSAVNIFSIRKNSWRAQLDIPYKIFFISVPGIQCNGSFHWSATTTRTPGRYEGELYYPLIAYDPTGGTCREIPLPDLLRGCDITVNVLQEKLWIADGLDLWVMNEYGVRDSWTKSLNVSDTDYEITASFPECSTDCGFIFVGRKNNFFIYDPEKNTHLEIQGMSSIRDIIYCMENIVRVDVNV